MGLLALLIAALLSNTAGAAPSTGTELEFAADTAAYEAGQVSVPVECVGGPTGFCSGSLSVSWHGRKAVSAFSVQGGHRDTVFVPLPLDGKVRGAKVAAVATTESLGLAVTRTAILHLR